MNRQGSAATIKSNLMEWPSWLRSCWRRGKRRGRQEGEQQPQQQTPSPSSSSPLLNLFIDLKVLEAATDGFSDANLLGKGGFGPVYKGVMGDGQEIAVKKLSLDSRQGVREFTNEVRLLLQVQHRNLVSLLGCCAAPGHHMLVYPYFPKRSLDHLLFDDDKNKRASLNWSKRFEIIMGVTKGLLYLHEESPVKIIHRDIKASNILLDSELNPKISDFGMARLFQGDATHVNTFRISGTYGYMAPEYALNGYLSAKTDVFSFGVLVLEIVSGRKNLDRRMDEDKVDLLSYVWRLFEDGKAMEAMDSSLTSWNRDEAALSIHMALLCCQAVVSDRPDMYTIHLMLCSDSFELPRPGRPGIRGRIGRWNSTSSVPSTIMTQSNTDSTSMGSATTKASATYCSVEDYSRTSITVSFTSEGR